MAICFRNAFIRRQMLLLHYSKNRKREKLHVEVYGMKKKLYLVVNGKKITVHIANSEAKTMIICRRAVQTAKK